MSRHLPRTLVSPSLTSAKAFHSPGLDQLQPLPDGFLLRSPQGIEEDFAPGKFAYVFKIEFVGSK